MLKHCLICLQYTYNYNVVQGLDTVVSTYVEEDYFKLPSINISCGYYDLISFV